MANSQRQLKSYKGFSITKINGYIYKASDGTSGELNAWSLNGIKKAIDEEIERRKGEDE